MYRYMYMHACPLCIILYVYTVDVQVHVHACMSTLYHTVCIHCRCTGTCTCMSTLYHTVCIHCRCTGTCTCMHVHSVSYLYVQYILYMYTYILDGYMYMNEYEALIFFIFFCPLICPIVFLLGNPTVPVSLFQY